MIIHRVPLEDHLNLKLTSKQISAVAKDVVKVSKLSRDEQIKCHARLEAKASRGQLNRILMCCVCGKLKNKSEFIDAHREKKVERRTCMRCALIIRKYVCRRVRVDGRLSFGCRSCFKFYPESLTNRPHIGGSSLYCNSCYVSDSSIISF